VYKNGFFFFFFFLPTDDGNHSSVLSPIRFIAKKNLCAFLILPWYKNRAMTDRKISIIMVMARKFA
jgi:hypothetical protein